jgi:uncharacterized membrane protein YphA (DoxX/SURF4 family)
MTMNEGAAHPGFVFTGWEVSRWKTALGWLSAIVISALFLVSGLWKITDVPGWAVRVSQLKIPASLSLAAALLFGIAETVAGVLILVPRFRRWGAWLAGMLLFVFLVYFAINYDTLRGLECSCFPWVKRVVGPPFFVADGVMLLLAVLAGIWAKPPGSIRSAIVVVAAVAVFAVVSYGVEITRQTGTAAPPTITVDGKPFATYQGKIFIYFFDPECLHCLEAGRKMAKLNWGETQVIAVPVAQPQFSQQFLQDTGLKAGVSRDLDVLKKTFPFVNAPAGVALVNGREKAMITNFDGDEPAATVRKLGFVY